MTGSRSAAGPATTEPCAAYLAAAEAAGAVHRLDGHLVLAGEFRDPLTDAPQCVIEYAAPALLADRHTVDRLLHLAGRIVPGARSVLLRRADGPALPAPWTRTLTYLRLDTVPEPPAAVGALSLREATDADAEAVRGWIAEAIRAGLQVRDTGAPAAAIAAETDRVWNRADRISLVALDDGRPAGHATLFRDESDDLTGEPFMELWDVLVARPELRRPATGLLVAAAAERARRSGLPLVGHVVHPTAPQDGDGDRIVASLTAKGWHTAHDYWLHRPGRGDA